jgi:CHAT domain-containing protein
MGVSEGHAAVGASRRAFSALPSVPAELEGIVRRDQATDRDGVLPGLVDLDAAFTAEALSEVLRARDYPVVHLATHFALESGDDRSFLLLGDGTPLSLRELRRQRFRQVDLVTLSACETAVSLNAQTGREIEGLGTIVQQRGAKGVIATLWPVADDSTASLMRTLYRLREEQQLSKAEALRQAQLALLRGGDRTAMEDQPRGQVVTLTAEAADTETDADSAPPFAVDPRRPHAHPYYWAPFILMGNWL